MKQNNLFTKALLLLAMIVGSVNAWATDYLLINGNDNTETATKNTTDFWTLQDLSTKSNGGTDYKKCIILGGNVSSGAFNLATPTRFIAYDLKTTSTSFSIKVYNTNGSDVTFQIYDIKETSAGVVTATVTDKKATKATLNTIEYNATRSAGEKGTIYIAGSSNANKLEFYQVTASESGTALTNIVGGSIGYSVNYNKGRFATKGGEIGKMDGIEIKPASDCKPTSTTEVKLTTKGTHYLKFSTSATTRTKITVTSAKTYYIASESNPADVSGLTAYTSSADVNLTTGDWYIVPNGSNVTITGLSFEDPDLTAPVLDTENSVPADGATNVPVAGTIVLKFDEKIGAVDASKYSLNNGGSVSSVAIDGSDKTKVNVAYTGLGYFANTTLTIAADGFADALGNANASDVTLSFKTMKETVATPVITPADGSSFTTATQSVTITCATGGATIYYTTDGSTPTASSTEYTGAFNISATTIIKAIALKEDVEDSEVATATITKVSADSYSFSYTSAKTIAELESEGWTFYSADFDADPADTEAYVNLVSVMNAEGGTDDKLKTPKNSGMEDNAIAFAKNTDAYAMYDLGSAKTVSGISLTLYGGSGSSFDETIEYIGADGTTVKKKYTNALNAGNWKANSINKTDVVNDVQYIKIYGASKWVVMYNFSVTYNETTPVSTLSGRSYGSYVTTKTLDFGNASGITAYIATGLNGESDAVVLSSVDVVPAGTPIIVKTETQGATVNVPVTSADASDVSGNKLVEGDGTAWNATANTTYYYLASDKFHEATSGNLKAGKAYLAIVSGGGAHELNIVFDDASGTTGIAELQNSKTAAQGTYYNLNGQRVNANHKGIVIVNGKKFMNK